MNAFKNTLENWKLASAGVGFRDHIISFLCARYSNISRNKKNVRRLLYVLIGLYRKHQQISVKFRISGKTFTIFLREGNSADYLVFGEMVVGGYAVRDNLSDKISEIHDGGANIGLFSLYAHAKYPFAQITCYEPEKENLAQLKINLKANQIDAVIIPKALWSETANLYFHPGESYSGFVSDKKSSYPIACIRPSISNKSWLKLDIEGAEYEVLPALLNAGCKPEIISIEIHDFRRKGMQLLNLLSESGYTWKGIFDFNAECITLSTYKTFE